MMPVVAVEFHIIVSATLPSTASHLTKPLADVHRPPMTKTVLRHRLGYLCLNCLLSRRERQALLLRLCWLRLLRRELLLTCHRSLIALLRHCLLYWRHLCHRLVALLRSIALHWLLHLTRTLHLPRLDVVEVPSVVLMNIYIQMNGNLLANLKRKLLNLVIPHVKHHALGILATFMLDKVGCPTPLISCFLTHSLLNRKRIYNNSRYDNIHNTFV